MKTHTMNKTLLISLMTLVSACSHLHPKQGPVDLKSDTAPANTAIHRSTKKPALASDRTTQLLEKRQAWCLLPEAEREQIDALLRIEENNSSVFQRLILSTCAPAKNAIQSQVLIAMIDRQYLNETDRALLALIDDSNQQLMAAQQEQRFLRSKLRNTIDGISDIETQMNSDNSRSLRGQQ